MPHANVNGTKLYYEVKGNGPVIVLIHGWSLNTEMWNPQLEEFSNEHTVLRYDLRGYGKSKIPEKGKPYAHHQDLKELLKHLNLDHVALVGLSMGGYVAMNFTLTYPEMTSALVLADSSLGGYKFSDEFNRLENGLSEKAKAEGVEAAKRGWVNFPFFKPMSRDPVVFGELKRIVDSYSFWDLLNDDPAVGVEPPAIVRLHEVRIPTLVVVGEMDSADFQVVADTVALGVRGAEKHVLSDVGHMVNMEAPERFNQLVLGFLRKSVKSN